MKVNKAVHAMCVKMIEDELSEARVRLRRNTGEINRLANEQRVLRATIGKLLGMLRTLNNENK